jgi:hypothetical protein
MGACLENAMIASEFDQSGGAHVCRHRAGRNDMKRFYASVAAAVALGGWASLVPASAAPPTVTPSPGYDARLQEQRAASTIYEPAVRYPRRVLRHRAKRIHHGVY